MEQNWVPRISKQIIEKKKILVVTIQFRHRIMLLRIPFPLK